MILCLPSLISKMNSRKNRLVVFLAQHLVALREVVAFLHLQPFQRLDQLGVSARPWNFDFSMPSLRAFIAS